VRTVRGVKDRRPDAVATRPDVVTIGLGAGAGAGSRPFVRSRPTVGGDIPVRWWLRTRAATLDWRRSVALACVLTFGAHLLFLSRELTSDEGGFAMVARGWRTAGPYLYGAQWVDRPPGLMVVFEAARAIGPFGVRVTAAVCATALVAAAAWASAAVRGEQAACWAAWTAFALASSPLLGAYELNGEIIGSALVLVSVAAALRAMYRGGSVLRLLLLGLLAGAAGASALLVKQNFADGLLFVGVLLTAGAVLRRFPLGRVLATGAGFLVGGAIPATAVVLWASTHAGVRTLLYATYGFRADAGDVIADGSWRAPEARLLQMLGLALASGLLVLAVQLLVSQRRALLSRSALVWAVTAAASLELLGVLLGANYWPHYLIGLIPMVVLAAGLACGSWAPGHRWTRQVVRACVVATMLAAPVAAVAVQTYRSHPYLVGRWVAASADRADTVVVPFSHANVIEASGLSSPYPYSWSLPVRTLDPGLVLLTKTLDRRHGAPTWVVRWDAADAWGLDPRGHLTRALATHYRKVAVVCGHPVWLHRGLHRSIAAVPGGCGDSYPVPASADR
jgi:hypothetical protein